MNIYRTLLHVFLFSSLILRSNAQNVRTFQDLLDLYERNAYQEVISQNEDILNSIITSPEQKLALELLIGNCYAQVALGDRAHAHYQRVVAAAIESPELSAVAKFNLAALESVSDLSEEPSQRIQLLYQNRGEPQDEPTLLLEGFSDLEKSTRNSSAGLPNYYRLLLVDEIPMTGSAKIREQLMTLAGMELSNEWKYFVQLNLGITEARLVNISLDLFSLKTIFPAEARLRQAAQIAAQTFGSKSRQTATSYINLGNLFDLSHQAIWEKVYPATFRPEFVPERERERELMLITDQLAHRSLSYYQKAIVASLKSFTDTLFYRFPSEYSLSAATIKDEVVSFNTLRTAFLLKENLFNLMTDHLYPEKWNWDYNVEHYRIRSTGIMSVEEGFDYTLSGFAYHSFAYYDKLIELYTESLNVPEDKLTLVQRTYKDRVLAVDAALVYENNTSGSVKGVSRIGTKNRAVIRVTSMVKRSPVLDAFKYSEKTKAILLLKEVKRLNNSSGNSIEETPTMPHINDLQKTLDANTAVVSYLISPYNFYIFVITQNDLKVHYRGKINSSAIGRQIKLLRNAILYQLNEPFVKTAAELGNILLPRIDKEITNLIIVPDGLLNTLPFETLLEDKVKGEEINQAANYPFLIKRYSISYAFSASLLLDNLKNSNQVKMSNFLGYAPVFADEDQESEVNNSTRGVLQAFDMLDSTGTRAVLKGSYITPIPNTESEVNYLNDLFVNHNMNSRVVTRALATEQTLKQEDFALFSILHLATHGFVNTAHPEQSGVLFMDDSLSRDDGILYGHEILKMKLNVDLVTLSACETGLGQVVEGEGVLGLSRAFTISGARNLLVSYWKVSDSSTSDLMKSFYSNALARPGDFSAPLQQAKLDLIQTGKYAQPYFWAAFILIRS